jgi:hypothetical protein
MKKIVILLLAICCVSGLRAQERKMNIYLNDGQRIVFDTGSISKITFTLPTAPKYDAMNIFTRYNIPNPDEHYTYQVDSITFGDTSIAEYIAIYDATREIAPGFPIKYPIDRAHGVDSITFSQFEKDTNIIELPNKYTDSAVLPAGDSGIGDYHSSVWRHNRIYCSEPLKYMDINSSFDVLKDSTIDSFINRRILFLSENKSASKLLFIQSRYGDASLGNLYEYDTQTDSANLVTNIVDSNVSSAEYYRDDSIIYYSYGSYSTSDTNPLDAGYYLLDLQTGNKTLLLHFISDLGPHEMVNGFDLSPDAKKLLIASTGNRVPLIMEYDIFSHTLDTLRVTFSPSNDRFGLWLRYSHDGTKILYSNYPLNSFDYEVDDTTEVGIIDIPTYSKRELSVNPTNEGLWLNVFPEWSPDDRSIVFGSANISREPPGAVGNYQVCILKSLKQ